MYLLIWSCWLFYSANPFHWGQPEDKSANVAMTQQITSAQKNYAFASVNCSTTAQYIAAEGFVGFFSGLDKKTRNRLNINRLLRANMKSHRGHYTNTTWSQNMRESSIRGRTGGKESSANHIRDPWLHITFVIRITSIIASNICASKCSSYLQVVLLSCSTLFWGDIHVWRLQMSSVAALNTQYGSRRKSKTSTGSDN